MSAFLVSKEHIVYIVTEAGKLDQYNRVSNEQAAKTANMLWRACLKSIRTRYPEAEETITKILPDEFPRDSRYEQMSLPELVQLAKAIQCYQYQSCEYDGFENSKANKYCISVLNDICTCLPGWDEAKWEIC